MKFRNIAAVAVGTILFSSAAFGADSIKVTLNGLSVGFSDAKPQIVNGRTMVPVRGLFEKMGYTVKWDSTTRTATLSSSDNTIVCTETKLTKTDNSTNQTTTVQSDVLPQILNNRFYLPLRSVSNAADCNVDWDSATKTVKISYVTENASTGSGSSSKSSSSSSSSSSSKNTTSNFKNFSDMTEEEQIEAQATFLTPEGDLTLSDDNYFSTIFPLLEQLKKDCLAADDPVFQVFFDQSSASEITGTKKGSSNISADIKAINDVTAVPSSLNGVYVTIVQYTNLVQQCIELSSSSADGDITAEETARKAKLLSEERKNISYDYADALYSYFKGKNVLWESVYGDRVLDYMS